MEQRPNRKAEIPSNQEITLEDKEFGEQNKIGALTGVAVGATVGAAVLPAALHVLGLSTLGPVGGGIFAWCQSLGWVGAGGALATA